MFVGPEFAKFKFARQICKVEISEYGTSDEQTLHRTFFLYFHVESPSARLFHDYDPILYMQESLFFKSFVLRVWQLRSKNKFAIILQSTYIYDITLTMQILVKYEMVQNLLYSTILVFQRHSYFLKFFYFTESRRMRVDTGWSWSPEGPAVFGEAYHEMADDGIDNPAFANEDDCATDLKQDNDQHQVTLDQDHKTEDGPVENGHHRTQFVSQQYVEAGRTSPDSHYRTETKIELPDSNDKTVVEPKMNGVHGNGNNNDASFLNNSATSVQINGKFLINNC